MQNHFDVVVIGAGAAGLMCAAQAGLRGLRVALVDHAERIAEKIRISGGGRCNFTNLEGGREDRYFGEQPRFARFALRAYPPERFIQLVREHGIDYHEKHKGQLFCDDSSERIIRMLLTECERARVQRLQPCQIAQVRRCADNETSRFEIECSAGTLRARDLVVATGGLSIPKIGATDLGHRLARQFGHRVIAPRPALVPLLFDDSWGAHWGELAGLSQPVRVRTGSSPDFDDDLLFTHRGLSGPAVLQASSFWGPGVSLRIMLSDAVRLRDHLVTAQASAGQRPLAAVLADLMPKRLAQRWLTQAGFAQQGARRIAELGRRDLARLVERLLDWQVSPTGTEGYRKAEVTAGGVATDEINARSLQSLRVPGLYFIGEVVDVTGWLGGYNFQWAWSSGWSAGQAVG
ncbi:MAG: hypothetical protein RI906_2240 [Pseudomonadota bacterium]